MAGILQNINTRAKRFKSLRNVDFTLSRSCTKKQNAVQ